jgi:hypothetical protein
MHILCMRLLMRVKFKLQAVPDKLCVGHFRFGPVAQNLL